MLQCPRCGKKYPDDVHVCPADFTPLHADETIAEVPVDRLIGRVFNGKYRLDARLGGGGMGTVYRATHLLIERSVAVKVLSQRFVGDETAQQRFRREARAAGRVQHPNAVTVTDFGATDGYLYIVMELLEGETLRQLLARESPLDSARAVSIMLQALAAVGAAHDTGLIHRDLKPANIFIEQRPHSPSIVKVLDFGLAKFAVEELDEDFQTLTQVGTMIGTPRYMSPEQCSGAGPLTPASDVYSLGIILYEMLSGAPPFAAETPLAIALRHVTESPRPLHEIVPSIPKELEAIVDRALSKKPSDRFVDANELRRELHATAERLGLEHFDSGVTPVSMEALRSAGNESPSGRLVIDLATLREVQALGSSGEHGKLADAPAVAATSAGRPAFDRVNVSLEKRNSRGRKIAALVLLGVIALVATAAVASRWWGASSTGPAFSSVAPTASPSPSAEVSPSASPSPSVSPKRSKRQQPRKKESGLGSFVKKVKRIFRR